jgi:hypothetical protein
MGRNTFSILAAMKLDAITVDSVIVDTVRGPQTTFAAILAAWLDGYSEPTGEPTSISHESAEAYFEQMIANIRDPLG